MKSRVVVNVCERLSCFPICVDKQCGTYSQSCQPELHRFTENRSPRWTAVRYSCSQKSVLELSPSPALNC